MDGQELVQKLLDNSLTDEEAIANGITVLSREMDSSADAASLVFLPIGYYDEFFSAYLAGEGVEEVAIEDIDSRNVAVGLVVAAYFDEDGNLVHVGLAHAIPGVPTCGFQDYRVNLADRASAVSRSCGRNLYNRLPRKGSIITVS